MAPSSIAKAKERAAKAKKMMTAPAPYAIPSSFYSNCVYPALRKPDQSKVPGDDGAKGGT